MLSPSEVRRFKGYIHEGDFARLLDFVGRNPVIVEMVDGSVLVSAYKTIAKSHDSMAAESFYASVRHSGRDDLDKLLPSFEKIESSC